MIADLNSSHFFSMSSDTSGSCLNLDDMLDANCFLTSLSSKASHLIREVTDDLLDLLFGQGFKSLKEHTTRWWSVDNSAPRFTRTSSTSENKSNETMQKSIKDFWFMLVRCHVYLWTSLCWRKVFMMRNPLLQQSCNKYFPFSITPVTPCFPITHFHVSVSVPTCALKSPIRTVDSVADTRRRASFTSSTKVWYSLVALGAYTCNRHKDRPNTLSFGIQTRDPKGIQSNTQSDNWGLVRIPTPA